jgi:hypothetical protein
MRVVIQITAAQIREEAAKGMFASWQHDIGYLRGYCYAMETVDASHNFEQWELAGIENEARFLYFDYGKRHANLLRRVAQ